jgi:hypothetical protein
MGYIITNTRGVITDQFDTIEELDSFTLAATNEASASGIQTHQYIWANAAQIDAYLSGSNEIVDETYFRFIYTTEQFENLSEE